MQSRWGKERHIGERNMAKKAAKKRVAPKTVKKKAAPKAKKAKKK